MTGDCLRVSNMRTYAKFLSELYGEFLLVEVRVLAYF